jgi:hypothetical protein
MAISSYFIGDYSWLFYWWLLYEWLPVAIILMATGGYSINGY